MKIKVKEIGWGLLKDNEGKVYIGVDDYIMNEETGEIYFISERDENNNVIEIDDRI